MNIHKNWKRHKVSTSNYEKYSRIKYSDKENQSILFHILNDSIYDIEKNFDYYLELKRIDNYVRHTKIFKKSYDGIENLLLQKYSVFRVHFRMMIEKIVNKENELKNKEYIDILRHQ